MKMQGEWACDHRFHDDCIRQWSAVANECPLCKAKYDSLVRGDGMVTAVKPREQSQDLDADYWGGSDPMLEEVICVTCNKNENEVQNCRHAFTTTHNH